MANELDEFRHDMFIECGFSEEEAFCLVNARGVDGFRLSHHDVRRYLDQGATHRQVLDIFLPW